MHSYMLSQTERTRSHSDFRMRWTLTQTFWKRIWYVSHCIVPSTLTTKLLTREKASMRNRSLHLISTFGGQKSVWDNANDIGDKAMLHTIRGPDTKCTDMLAYYFQYHRVCMNSYLTRRVHSQEKACPSTHTSPCDAVMTHLVSCLDESLFRDGAIFFVTVLRNEF